MHRVQLERLVAHHLEAAVHDALRIPDRGAGGHHLRRLARQLDQGAFQHVAGFDAVVEVARDGGARLHFEDAADDFHAGAPARSARLRMVRVMPSCASAGRATSMARRALLKMPNRCCVIMFAPQAFSIRIVRRESAALAPSRPWLTARNWPSPPGPNTPRSHTRQRNTCRSWRAEGAAFHAGGPVRLAVVAAGRRQAAQPDEHVGVAIGAVERERGRGLAGRDVNRVVLPGAGGRALPPAPPRCSAPDSRD